jgi:uncharacterized glyoxalase superfamily protein PhnB
MTGRIVPMIHVPNVSATADWYNSIGFTILRTAENEGEIVWALLGCGDSRLMLNTCGKPSAKHRREVDLYIHIDDVDALYADLKDRVEVVEDVHDTFYGQREFIIRDFNRFWITFGQPCETS